MSKYSPGQQKIIEVLIEKGKANTQEIINETYLSTSFVRTQVRLLELSGCIEKLDERVPYIYRINPGSDIGKRQKYVDDFRKCFLDKDAYGNAVAKLVLSKNIKDWGTYADLMESAAIAIRELEAEGKLIETL